MAIGHLLWLLVTHYGYRALTVAILTVAMLTHLTKQALHQLLDRRRRQVDLLTWLGSGLRVRVRVRVRARVRARVRVRVRVRVRLWVRLWVGVGSHLVVPVDHDHDADSAGREAPRVLPRDGLLAVAILVLDLEHLAWLG